MRLSFGSGFERLEGLAKLDRLVVSDGPTPLVFLPRLLDCCNTGKLCTPFSRLNPSSLDSSFFGRASRDYLRWTAHLEVRSCDWRLYWKIHDAELCYRHSREASRFTSR